MDGWHSIFEACATARARFQRIFQGGGGEIRGEFSGWLACARAELSSRREGVIYRSERTSVDIVTRYISYTLSAAFYLVPGSKLNIKITRVGSREDSERGCLQGKRCSLGEHNG